MKKIQYPQNDDLRSLVRFCADTGHIWLDEQRMILLHTGALGSLRKELIDSLGMELARGLLTRMGYASGARDAELAKKVRRDSSEVEAFVVGPQLHMLEGIVRVEPVKLEMDIRKGKFSGEFIWRNSWEDQTFRQDFGVYSEPVCWMQIGYASGYTSTFMGRFIMYKEVECYGAGDAHCRIVGKPAEEWADAEKEIKYFRPDSIMTHLLDLQSQVVDLRSSLDQEKMQGDMVGVSAGFRAAYELLKKAADSQITVLLLGETGVGKEMFARALHAMSSRANGPFVAVNCAAIPHELMESELFGVEKGAYTGAQQSRPGRFERAHGGTLFLDEVGELPPSAQAKLLRALQEGEIERLGDERTRKVNVRVVAATNVNLQQAVKEGKFRCDLYYRLNAYPITIPPLRDRRADIPLLVQRFVEKYSAIHGKKVKGVSDKGMRALQSYSWPGNIRELENAIERGIILAPNGGRIEVEHLFIAYQEDEGTIASLTPEGGLDVASPSLPKDLYESVLGGKLTLEELEAHLLKTAVERAGGNLSLAARMLGITRPQLAYRLKQLEST